MSGSVENVEFNPLFPQAVFLSYFQDFETENTDHKNDLSLFFSFISFVFRPSLLVVVVVVDDRIALILNTTISHSCQERDICSSLPKPPNKKNRQQLQRLCPKLGNHSTILQPRKAYQNYEHENALGI